MEDANDQLLLEAFACDGCEESFRTLVERHGRLVRGVALRMLGNEADAEEAAQAAFIALALKAKRLNARGGLGGWLHRVARQVSLDLRKARARRWEREGEAARRHAFSTRAVEAEGDLDDAIAALPRKLREAVIGHYLEGEPLEALARREQCSVSAISMRLTRARERLRARLERSRHGAGAVAAALWEKMAGLPGLSPEAAAATARMARSASQGAAAMQGAGLLLLQQANEALNRLLLARLKWAAIGSAASVAAVGLLVGGAKTPLLAEPPPARVSRPLPVAVEAPPPASAAPEREEPAEAPAPPPLIAAVQAPFDWKKMNDFKKVLDRENGKIDAIRDHRGLTALHWAAFHRRNDYAVLLIRRGADVNAVDERGYTPLFYAVTSGASWLQKELVLAGADPNRIAQDRKTALTLAIELGRAQDAEALLWMGAKLRLPELEEAEQPLSIAKQGGNGAVNEALGLYEQAEAQGVPRIVPMFVRNALHDAAKKADYEQLQAFLGGGANVNLPDENGRTPLFHAVGSAQEEVVFYLLMLGANPNIADHKGETPLMASMGWLGESFDSVRRFLILKNAYPFALRKNGFSELTWAVRRGNVHGVQWLLWLGANGREPTSRGTPFQIAFQEGRQVIMDLLRRNGIDEPVRLSDDPVWNLHNAVRRGDEKLLLEMLARGVPVDTPDKGGHSPLTMAIATQNLKTADLLIAHGADLNFRNEKNGDSPFAMTMVWDYPEMQEFRKKLFEAGADPNVQNAKGETPLMRGVWKYPAPPLRQLVEVMGVDLNLRDKQGKTALGRAIEAGHHRTADYLREAGATE